MGNDGIEFLVPLRRRDGIPRSVLRAVVEAGGVLRVLSDSGSDTHEGGAAAFIEVPPRAWNHQFVMQDVCLGFVPDC